MLSPPTRLDNDVYESARAQGELASRSAAQQIAHWARIGRQLELAESTSWQEIALVLDGDADYDALGNREQAIVRAVWSERLEQLAATVDLTAVFAAQGRTTASVAAADGTLVTVELDKGRPIKKRAVKESATKTRSNRAKQAATK